MQEETPVFHLCSRFEDTQTAHCLQLLGPMEPWPPKSHLGNFAPGTFFFLLPALPPLLPFSQAQPSTFSLATSQ